MESISNKVSKIKRPLGLAAGGFFNASVAFTDGLVIQLEAFQYLIF